MGIIDKLASSLNRRDEVPNRELALEIVAGGDKNAVRELVENLAHKNKDIQHDCIKVLYEIGEQKPGLIAAYADTFVALLTHKNNRLQWGAMAALDSITPEDPKTIFASFSQILAAVDKGSVITKDHGVNILIKLTGMNEYAESAFPLLIEQLHTAPANQLPMYAERAMAVINKQNKDAFVKTLTGRLPDMEKESKRKRVEKVLKQCEKVKNEK